MIPIQSTHSMNSSYSITVPYLEISSILHYFKISDLFESSKFLYIIITLFSFLHNNITMRNLSYSSLNTNYLNVNALVNQLNTKISYSNYSISYQSYITENRTMLRYFTSTNLVLFFINIYITAGTWQANYSYQITSSPLSISISDDKFFPGITADEYGQNQGTCVLSYNRQNRHLYLCTSTALVNKWAFISGCFYTP